LPFRYWFLAIHLLTSTKKSFSAAKLQRQLGHKRFEPIWTLLHKLREIMGKNEMYSLSGEIERDKSKVLVMAESQPIKRKITKNGSPKQVRYIKMIVINDLK